jgi:hypothetical protein
MPPRLLVTAKLIAPCSGAGCPALYAVSAKAVTATSSNATNRLNRSPVRQKSTLAARKIRTRAWWRPRALSKYRRQ